MLYSVLNDESTCYVNMHAECALHVYVNDFMEEDSIKSATRCLRGMYCGKVNADVLQNLYNYTYEDKDFCVDFKWIEEILDNNLVSFVSYIKREFCAKNRIVYLLNIQQKIFDRMGIESGFQVIEKNDSTISVILGKGKDAKLYTELLERKEVIFKEKLEKVISECTVEQLQNERKHASVPVYLSKYINIKEMAENNLRFFRLGIYYLALDMIQKGIMSREYHYNKDKVLFFHTMNGGFVATQLAQLFNVDMVYLDHLGPLGIMHRKHFEKSILDMRKYIIVSDVICLGGEVSRAKTIIEYCGGEVCGEICVVDIKTVENDRNENRISLYTVSKMQNKLGYLIETDLCYGCKKENGCEK